MTMFIVGLVVGVVADRSYPVPISYLVDKVKALWAKASNKSE